jgi:hypothetical protein
MADDMPNPLASLQTELGRALLTKVAPEEEPFYDDIVLAQNSKTKKSRDRTLGFGVSLGDIGIASGASYLLAKPILDFLWDKAKDAAGDLIKDEAQTATKALAHRFVSWLKSNFEGPSPVRISPDERNLLVADLTKDAEKIGLDKDLTGKLVNAIDHALI